MSTPIEQLELDIKTYNRLKRDGINTSEELLGEMYKSGNDITVSTSDAKKCEAALKAAGIIRFMRGDIVTENDIEPEPLTWDELHGYIGRLVVHDESTESRRWLVVCWLYDVKEQDCGNAIFISRGTSFGHARRATVNGDLSRTDNPILRNEGQFFALKEDENGTPHYKELPQPNNAPVIVESEEYNRAVTLTKRIKANAQAAQESLWEVCRGLKEIHDGKLYKELEYNSFEDYCESEVGLSRFMAYKYVAIAEMKNVESIQHFGVTKLSLLAKLDEPQRVEIQQAVDVGEVSVKELKAEIEKFKAKETGYKERQDKLLQKNKELVSDIEKSSKERERIEGERDRLEDDLDEAKDTIKSLERQLEELESKPRDSYEDTTKIDELKKQLAEAEKRADGANRSAYSDNAVFSAYASAATDAMRRLTQFCERRSDSSEKTVFIAKLKMIVALTEQTIEKIGG